MAEAAPPHIVWIYCDQLRADALGFMGNSIVRTPNLDRLAALGTVFDNMYVQCPVCMGSRGCMITGRYLRNIGMAGGSPFPDAREVTFPELLQRDGYRTGMFGKLHLTPQQFTKDTLGSDRPIADLNVFRRHAGLPPAPDDPFKRNFGFQELAGFEDILWGEYIDWVVGRDSELAATLRRDRYGAFHSDFPDGPLADVGMTDIPIELHPSVYIADSAADFFRRNHRQAPCHMHVSFVDPHHPWDPPRAMAGRYPPTKCRCRSTRSPAARSGRRPWPRAPTTSRPPRRRWRARPLPTTTP